MNNQSTLCSCLNLQLEIQETNSLLDSKKTINKEIIEILEDPVFSKRTINGHKIVSFQIENRKGRKDNNDQFEKELIKLNQQTKQILNLEKEKMKQELKKLKQRQENQFEQLKLTLKKEKQLLWNNILKIQNEFGIKTEKPKYDEKKEFAKEKENQVKGKEKETEKEKGKEKGQPKINRKRKRKRKTQNQS
ncbi:hypothetical protein M0812_11187 [Anaeramoeba flamelloides]|uniref:Uncharacterized protein n=1 Tax=Anaeramoeba flamelloides TaxID=1746091 RepID=A0AAV7ZZF5_9EUKA|nr:hypothetical protein M0812_11187 [Anaeramoeba flamelloides]